METTSTPYDGPAGQSAGSVTQASANRDQHVIGRHRTDIRGPDEVAADAQEQPRSCPGRASSVIDPRSPEVVS
ncbi:hypothetical protein ABZ297_05640 [Nonomuraea sp. NPDC005983]|uniref:hypothetical protein n=1 Tax=Nonomuraea sp. NPDC005983 TaxID=3155595 RepID=UPI0033B66B39